jgi:hypothetical protein
MLYCYLFEAKAIQSYLFASGKLKDIISASERLDRLIDTSKDSLLAQVLDTAELASDLNEDCSSVNNDIDASNTIRFLRAKGGTFYAYSQNKESLLTLRSLWTLTLQQAFPSLEFVDALCQAETLINAIDQGTIALAQDRNMAKVRYPLASIINERYSRTGNAAVPISALADRAAMAKEMNNGNDSFDIDTEHHRQAYQTFSMRSSAALQDKFTPMNLQGEISYPINLDGDFRFDSNGDQNKADQNNDNEVIKDMAIIHIDGNGLGIILMALRVALKDKSNDVFQTAFRLFSEALNTATIQAAQAATQFVFDNAQYKHKEKTFLPMRPIVLGGDDITLLIRADLALEYSKIFCTEFEKTSRKALKPLFNKELQNSDLKDYLTASGGILFHKAGHPIMQSLHLVESLCNGAKKLTKQVYANNDGSPNDQKVGPAAMAIYRTSASVSDDFESLMNNAHTHTVGEKNMALGQGCYFIETQSPINSEHRHTQSNQRCDFSTINKLVEYANRKDNPGKNKPAVNMAKWRQIAGLVAENNLTDAKRMYHRACNLSTPESVLEMKGLLASIVPTQTGTQEADWYWENAEQNNDQANYISFLNDLLILDHFKFVSSTTNNVDEQLGAKV